MGIVADLNEAARKDHNRDRADLARQFAIDIAKTVRRLATDHSRATMRRLNGLWAQAEKLLGIMQEPSPPNPSSDIIDERKVA